MGGLKHAHAANAHRVPRRLARTRGHPDLRGLLVEGRDHRGRVRERTTRSARTLYAAGLVGALLTGLYTFRLYFAVFRGEPSELVKEHAHEGHGEGPRSMLVPVGVLTVLATIGGLVVIPGVWEPFLHWIDETAEPLVHATVAEDYGTSAIAVSLGARRLLRRAARVPRRSPARRRVPASGACSSTSSTSTSCTTRSSTGPAAAVSDALRRNVEEPVVERSLDEIGSGTIQVGGEVARVQSGLLRTYAVAIAFAVAVLVVVFVAVR